MIIICIIVLIWSLTNLPKAVKRQHSATVPAYVALSPAEIQRREKAREKAAREAEKAREKAEREEARRRKAEHERQLAENELNHLSFLRGLYQAQYTALETEKAEATTNEKRRAQIDREILKIDEKLYKIDIQAARAKFKAAQN